MIYYFIIKRWFSVSKTWETKKKPCKEIRITCLVKLFITNHKLIFGAATENLIHGVLSLHAFLFFSSCFMFCLALCLPKINVFSYFSYSFFQSMHTHGYIRCHQKTIEYFR